MIELFAFQAIAAHIAIGFLLTFGFLLPRKFLLVAIFAWPVVWIHWRFNGGRCLLTDIEHRMRERERDPKTNDPFCLRAIRLAGLRASPADAQAIMITAFSIAWAIALYRYAFHRA